MRYIFLVLGFFGTLFAGKIGPVEYQLPNVAQDWVIHEFENEKIACSFYEASEELDDAWSGFVALVSSDPLDLTDPLPPGTVVGPGVVISACSVLERTENSILCALEILALECESEEEAILYSLCRIFSFETGHVILAYLAENSASPECSDWILALQEAGLVTDSKIGS